MASELDTPFTPPTTAASKNTEGASKAFNPKNILKMVGDGASFLDEQLTQGLEKLKDLKNNKANIMSQQAPDTSPQRISNNVESTLSLGVRPNDSIKIQSLIIYFSGSGEIPPPIYGALARHSLVTGQGGNVAPIMNALAQAGAMTMPDQSGVRNYNENYADDVRAIEASEVSSGRNITDDDIGKFVSNTKPGTHIISVDSFRGNVPAMIKQFGDATAAGKAYGALRDQFDLKGGIGQETADFLQNTGFITGTVTRQPDGRYAIPEGAMKAEDRAAFQADPAQAILDRLIPHIEEMLRKQKGEAYDKESDEQKVADQKELIAAQARRFGRDNDVAEALDKTPEVSRVRKFFRDREKNYSFDEFMKDNPNTDVGIRDAAQDHMQITFAGPQMKAYTDILQKETAAYQGIGEFLKTHPDITTASVRPFSCSTRS